MERRVFSNWRREVESALSREENLADVLFGTCDLRLPGFAEQFAEFSCEIDRPEALQRYISEHRDSARHSFVNLVWLALQHDSQFSIMVLMENWLNIQPKITKGLQDHVLCFGPTSPLISFFLNNETAFLLVLQNNTEQELIPGVIVDRGRSSAISWLLIFKFCKRSNQRNVPDLVALIGQMDRHVASIIARMIFSAAQERATEVRVMARDLAEDF